MTRERLPDGWQWVRFGDVVREVTVHEREPLEHGLTRYVGLDHLDPHTLKIRRWGLIEQGITFTKQFRAGQVLFGKRRAYQRKAAVPDFDGICSSDILVFEAEAMHLLPDLLPFLVHTDAFFEHALGTSSGSLSPRTKWRELADFSFPLPPLARQRELVELFQGLEDAIAATEESIAAAEALRRAMFRELLQPQDNWTLVRLREVADVHCGLMRSPEKMSGKHKTPYLRAANIKPGFIDFSDVLEMDFTPKEREKLSLRPGDILLVEGNANPDYVGAPAIYTEDMPRNMCFQKTLVRVVAWDRNVVLPMFLYNVLISYYNDGVFAEIATGMATQHIGSGRTAELEISYPSVDEQQRIIEQLGSCDNQLNALQTHLFNLQSMKAQVVNAALSGAHDERMAVLAGGDGA